ncbi:cupin domain-containing protein [Paenibacillus sp. BR2-3]|uniref:cupin domain-containing protein n=1 Tax=Paenibacillus sp. BR2-3 TaxID=3048494 RepID=UPI0039772794
MCNNSKSTVIEPHYHSNAAELIYCICGAAVVSLINPITKELLDFPICPGQVANLPQGWLHYIVAAMDDTHLLAIFDAPIPETIYGSDLLRLTPANIISYTYCLDKAQVEDTLSPIKTTTVLGPPPGCCDQGNVPGKMTQSQQASGYQPYPAQGYYNQGYTAQYLQQPYVQQSPYRQYPGIQE